MEVQITDVSLFYRLHTDAHRVVGRNSKPAHSATKQIGHERHNGFPCPRRDCRIR